MTWVYPDHEEEVRRMEVETIVVAVAAGIAALSAAFAGMGLVNNSRQLWLDRKIRTLEYVTAQFDRLAELGAREEMRKMHGQDVLSYTSGDTEKTQKVLEYVYTLNRIGAGISGGALSEDVIFNIWPPEWIEGYWKRLEPLVEQERRRRGDEVRGSYVFFDWLAREKCPKVRDKYPDRITAQVT